MKKLFVALAVFTTVSLGSIFAIAATTPTETVANQAKIAPKPMTKDELLTLVNKEREKVGVAPLAIDERLNQSAQRKADDMDKFDYFDHISPNDGRHGYEYANDTAIQCVYVGENLQYNGYGKNTSVNTVDSWYKSKLHREAMLDSKYSLTGFGIAGSRIVQHFCQVK